MHRPTPDLRKKIIPIIGTVCLLATACTSSSEPTSLTVAAAGSLTLALEALGQAYTESSGTPVVFTFAATGNLAQQIRNGAPYDLFAAADARHVDELISDGFLDPGTRFVYAHGSLVLLVSTEASSEVETPADLRKASIRLIALANPDHAPYGIAAQEALLSLGLWEELQPKLVLGETVRQAAQMVETGNAQAGLVAASSIGEAELKRLPIPKGYHQPIEHVLAIRTGTPLRSQAEKFVAFLSSPLGRTILEANHLRVPEP